MKYLFAVIILQHTLIIKAQNTITSCIPKQELTDVKSLLKLNAAKYYLPGIFESMNDLTSNTLYKTNTLKKDEFVSNLIRQNFTSENSYFYDFFIKNKSDSIPTITTILSDLYVQSSDYNYNFYLDTSSIYINDNLFWGQQNGEFFHYLILYASTICIKTPVRSAKINADTISQELGYFFRFPINSSGSYPNPVLENDDQKLKIWQVLNREAIRDGNRVSPCEFPEIPEKYVPDLKEKNNSKIEAAPSLQHGYGKLSIQSNPSGATIKIKGSTGIISELTPYEFAEVSAMRYQITLSKNGYEDATGFVEVLPGGNATFYKELIPKGSSIKFDIVPFPDSIFIDGKYKPINADDSIPLQVGNHKIELRKKGHHTEAFVVIVIAGETKIIKRELRPKLCNVSFIPKNGDESGNLSNIFITVDGNPKMLCQFCKLKYPISEYIDTTLAINKSYPIEIQPNVLSYWHLYDTINLTEENCPFTYEVSLKRTNTYTLKIKPNVEFKLKCNGRIIKSTDGKYRLPEGEVTLLFEINDNGKKYCKEVKRQLFNTQTKIDIDLSKEGSSVNCE
jgi:hypothetical protein